MNIGNDAVKEHDHGGNCFHFLSRKDLNQNVTIPLLPSL